MMTSPNDDLQQLRAQIAATAARLIAQDGADYASARRKAARQVLGVDQPSANVMPDNAEIEDEVRRYLRLFGGSAYLTRLRSLRAKALELMEALAAFRPYLTGAVCNGSAGEFDYIHLQLFADSAKEVEIFLLNQNVSIEIGEAPHFKGARHGNVESVRFDWQRETVVCELYAFEDMRGALKARADGRPQRLDADGLRALMLLDDSLEQNNE